MGVIELNKIENVQGHSRSKPSNTLAHG